MKLKQKINVLLLLALLGLPALARAQGTAFSYQGRLLDQGVAPNAAYDFIFSLFDSDAAGIQIGQDVTLNGVSVANGQFNATLDFGAGSFPGDPRWLEISVRPAGVGQFTKMDARVSLLPTPYAIFAATAGSAATAASVASGAVTPDQLYTGGVAPMPGQFLSYNGGNLVWSDPAVAAGNVWSLNGLDAYYNGGNVGIGGLAGASKLQITGADALTLSAAGGPYLTWRDTTTGRSAAISSAGGTLYYRVPDAVGNVLTAGYVDSNGMVTRGRLSVEGFADMAPGGSGGTIHFGTPNAETGMTITGANRADIRFDGSTMKLLAGTGTGPPPLESGIAITTAGYVGIGTTTPIAKLDAENPDSGKSAVFGNETGTSGVGVYGGATAPSGVGVFARNLNGVAVFADGDVAQTRAKGGLIKGMVVVAANGTIARAYNGVTGASGNACGFNINNLGSGLFGIDFGFQVNDRFVSVTPGLGEASDGSYKAGTTASVLYGYQPTFIGESHPNSIFVQLILPADSVPFAFAPASFTVIVY